MTADDTYVPYDAAVADRAASVHDLAQASDLASGPDLVASIDLAHPPDLVTSPDLATGLGGNGDPCGQSANGRSCAQGLACCYPCGIPGCVYRCQTPCAAGPGCVNGCLLIP